MILEKKFYLILKARVISSKWKKKWPLVKTHTGEKIRQMLRLFPIYSIKDVFQVIITFKMSLYGIDLISLHACSRFYRTT